MNTEDREHCEYLDCYVSTVSIFSTVSTLSIVRYGDIVTTVSTMSTPLGADRTMSFRGFDAIRMRATPPR